MAIELQILGDTHTVDATYYWTGNPNQSVSYYTVNDVPVAYNYATNPKTGSDTATRSLYKWSALTAAGDGAELLANYSTDTKIPYGVTNYARLEFAPGALSSGGLRYTESVTAGQAYSIGMSARTSMVGGNIAFLRIVWFNSSNVEVGNRSYSDSVNLNGTTTWSRLTVENIVAPAGAVKVYIDLYGGSTAAAWTAGSFLYATAIMLAQDTSLPEQGFFDGDTNPGKVTVRGTGVVRPVSTTNLIDYSVTEDATPLDPNDNSGGISQLTFDVIDQPAGSGGTMDLLNNSVNLLDASNGKISGVIKQLDFSDDIVKLTVNSRLDGLLNTATAAPYQGNLETTFKYYLSLGRIYNDTRFVQPTSTSAYLTDATTVRSFPGWTGIVLDELRAWAIAHGGEISLVGNTVIMRPLRSREVVVENDEAHSWTASQGDLAQTVEVYYYNNSYKLVGDVYPTDGWNDDVEIFSVASGETITQNVPITASLMSLDQPFASETPVDRYQTGTALYSVVDNNGKFVPGSIWRGRGGNLHVDIGADGKSLDIIITGGNMANGPFRIGSGKADSDRSYSTLRITGRGNFVKKKLLTISTGVTDAETPTVVGATIDSKYISSSRQAYSLGLITAAKYAGSQLTLSASSISVNRRTVSDIINGPTLDDFNTGLASAPAWTGLTFDDFTATWDGKKFDAFNAYYLGLTDLEFANQAFGNTAGSRVKYRSAYYRINSATIQPGAVNAVSYQATRDTTFNDFAAEWALRPFEKQGVGARTASYTINDFNKIYENRTFYQHAYTPLWRTYVGDAANQPRP